MTARKTSETLYMTRVLLIRIAPAPHCPQKTKGSSFWRPQAGQMSGLVEVRPTPQILTANQA
jgi:hypothetical protein